MQEKLSTREKIFVDTLKRMFLTWQLYRFSLEELRTSDTAKDWAAEAKAFNNKSFVDMRVLAAEQLRYVQAFMIKLKQGIMRPETFNAIMKALTSDQMKELSLLLDEVSELSEQSVEHITLQVREGKQLANEKNKENGISTD